jgi:hypothetical protein
MPPRRVRVARFVHDQAPEAALRSGRAEVLEVEREDRQLVAFRDRHDGRVGQAEVEVGEAGVYLGRASQEPGGEEGDLVLAGVERGEEQPGRVSADPRAQQLVDLDDDRLRDDQVPADPRDQLGGQAVRPVAPVGRREQRPGVGDDPQRAVTSLVR